MAKRRDKPPPSASRCSARTIAAAGAAAAVVAAAYANASVTKVCCEADVCVGSCSYCDDVYSDAAWQRLNDSARARLFVSAAAKGLLGPGLQSCASLMNVGSSRGIRGAVAAFDLPKDSGCIVGRDELISIATVRARDELALSPP